MAMAAKKERGRFSLRFNIGDPVQRAAVELLELQPPHSKAQYIANALTYYNAHFADDPQPLKMQTVSREAIEEIVREILRQEGQQTEQNTPTAQTTAESYSSQLQADLVSEQQEDLEIDVATRDMIFSTMAAFRKGG